MTLRVVGAGLGRTGTMSLKLALEKLLGGPCYHMLEVFPRPDHIAMWREATETGTTDWDRLFQSFVAAVDWPASAFWRELSDANPDAIILLSARDADVWWKSCDNTIWEVFKREAPSAMEPWLSMVRELFAQTFTERFLERDEAIAAYERHNMDVRSTADPSRLVEWEPGDGWGPICAALGVPVPQEPFPHANTTDEFRGRAGWD